MHTLITNQPHHIFQSLAKALAQCPESDEDLTYVVAADPRGSGRAIIKVYDTASGDFIANM
jgi:hypothetical protein